MIVDEDLVVWLGYSSSYSSFIIVFVNVLGVALSASIFNLKSAVRICVSACIARGNAASELHSGIFVIAIRSGAPGGRQLKLKLCSEAFLFWCIFEL